MTKGRRPHRRPGVADQGGRVSEHPGRDKGGACSRRGTEGGGGVGEQRGGATGGAGVLLRATTDARDATATATVAESAPVVQRPVHTAAEANRQSVPSHGCVFDGKASDQHNQQHQYGLPEGSAAKGSGIHEFTIASFVTKYGLAL